MTKHEHNQSWHSLFFRRGHLLALSIIVLIVAGISALSQLPRLEDPRIDTRHTIVITPYPGASAERVEALITDVLEDELRQLHEIKEIRSTSRADISLLTVELQDWVDNSTNEQIFSKIRDALGDAAQRFPPGAGEPDMDEKRGATAFTLLLAIKSSEDAPLSLAIRSRLAQELGDRLRNLPGTELVRIYGGLEEEIAVDIDQQQLAQTGLSITQASQIVAAADTKLPAGVMRNGDYNLRLQLSNELDSLQRVRNIPLLSHHDGSFLRLGDIASVQRRWLEPANDMVLVNGERVVMVAARMQATVRVDKWTAAAKQKVALFEEEFSASVQVDEMFEQNLYTQARLADLTSNLLLGCLVVMLVVWVFMGTQSAWIVGLSLPLCAAFALFSLSFYGQQIHQMTIFGIIVAIGLLIDNAIVITDEIRSNLLRPETSRQQALIDAVKHLFSPLFASTLTTILGFMPIFLLPGNIGDFVGPLAISVVMALIGSLFISMTIIGPLAAHFIKRPRPNQASRWYLSGVSAPIISRGFEQLLVKAIKKPLLWLMICVALPLAGFVLAGQLGNVFFPSADRDQFELYVWTPQGTSIEKTRNIAVQIEKEIRRSQGVKQVLWLVGGSAPSVYYNQMMNRDNSPNFAQAIVTMNAIDEAAALIAPLQRRLDQSVSEAKIAVRAFGQGPPISAPIGVKIFGTDPEKLNQLGEQVRLLMMQVPGVSQSIASINQEEPQLLYHTDGDTSRLANLNMSDIASQLQAALDGRLGGSILEGTEEIPIRLRLSDANRGNKAHIESLQLLPVGSTQQLSLSSLGEFSLQPSISAITRINGERVNIVEGFLLPNAPALDATKRLQKLMQQSGFDLPPGYRIQLAGDADKQREAVGQLATYAPVLAVLMLATLILTFSSVRLASVIGAVALLSVGLGMLSLWISGLPVGFNPMLGCAGLIGVAINGSIVVIAAINANPQAYHGNIEAIVKETMGCSRHILSTTFTTVGGFIPLLLFSEGTFWPPLAVVLAGGVGFSVLLSLLFTPIVAGQLARRRGRKAQKVGVSKALSVG